MMISILLMLIIAGGGFALTYLIDDEPPLLWRIAAGNVIGSAICGTLGFVLALMFGLTTAVVAVAMALTLLPLLLFYRADPRNKLRHDWARAKGKLQGANTRRFLRFAFYGFFFLLFFFFFDRAMLEMPGGIFTGGSQNLGDLPFHLGAISAFTDGNNFPPENPSFSGARFSYPFVADLLTACFVRFGAGVRDAMFVQNVAWALSLLVILERWVLKLTGDNLAGRIAPALLFFSGGLGFLWFFSDYAAQAKSFFDFLSHLPKDYTIGDDFRWGNSLVVLFITQRSLLLGMPFTLIVLGYLWKVFTAEPFLHPSTTPASQSLGHPSLDKEGKRARLPSYLRRGGIREADDGVVPDKKLRLNITASLAVGILAGLLPLVHLHSLAVLFVVGVFLFILKPEKWLTWSLFAGGVAVIAVPELLWSVAGSASETQKFFAWHFGWDKGEKNFFWFWFINTGIFIPILLFAIDWFGLSQWRKDAKQELPKHGHKDTKKKPSKAKVADDRAPLGAYHSQQLLLFFLPFAFLFVVSNVAKLAPWEWDNIKVLIYWFVGSIPFVALFISWLWRHQAGWFKAAAVVCFVVLIASGALDVWRTVSAQINYKVFDKDAVEVAEQIKRRTPAKAMFLNAPTYNTAVALTGRRSLMRYPGHLNSHGIDYSEREADVKRMYSAGDPATSLMEKYGIEYVLVSPEERNIGPVNDQFFSRFPVAAESGQYRVYKIK